MTMPENRNAACTCPNRDTIVGSCPVHGDAPRLAGTYRPIAAITSADCPHIDHGEFTLCDVERQRRNAAYRAALGAIANSDGSWDVAEYARDVLDDNEDEMDSSRYRLKPYMVATALKQLAENMEEDADRATV